MFWHAKRNRSTSKRDKLEDASAINELRTLPTLHLCETHESHEA